MTTLIAHYDGKVLVPEVALDLPINQPLKVTIETAEAVATHSEGHSALVNAAPSDLMRFLDELHTRKHIRVGDRPTRARTYAGNPRLR